jgi:molybdate transport system substrate-binding protein
MLNAFSIPGDNQMARPLQFLPLLFVLGIVVIFSMPVNAGAADETSAAVEPLQIAVAANFQACLREIVADYTDQGGSPAVVIVGSTGRHFAQIRNGAPFDLFFAADEIRPRLLEESGHAVPGSRFTYAFGRLVLWAPDIESTSGTKATDVLATGAFDHLAIANPRLAPYGLAARQMLKSLGLWETLSDRLVTGQTVGQAWQFVASGSAEAGLLAASQTASLEDSAGIYPVSDHLYESIVQQAVLLKRAADNPAARDFLSFVKSPAAGALIRAAGYGIADGMAEGSAP